MVVVKDENNNYVLAPCYDLLSTKIAVPEDKEEMALTINAKKNRIERSDFDIFGKTLGLTDKQKEDVFFRFSRQKEKLLEFISIGFLSDDLKQQYTYLVKENAEKLKL